jgi:type VI secretion system secreted protein Hcp
MAVDMFFKIQDQKGVVKGESKDSVHKDEIGVLAWSWGLSNSGTFGDGGGGGGGKANLQDLSFTKYVDSSSPTLLTSCVTGAHLKDAILTVRKAGGTKPIEYIKITLTKALVSSVSTGGSGGEDRLTENVTLNFAKVKFEYSKQKDDGSADAPTFMTWDQEAIKA